MLWRGGKATRSPRGRRTEGERCACRRAAPHLEAGSRDLRLSPPLSLNLSALSSRLLPLLQWGRGGGREGGGEGLQTRAAKLAPLRGAGGRPEAASRRYPGLWVNVAVCCGTASQHCESSGPPPPSPPTSERGWETQEAGWEAGSGQASRAGAGAAMPGAGAGREGSRGAGEEGPVAKETARG